jgi:hypothetical protein
MLDHLQERILHIMKTNERLDKSNAICSSVLAKHDLKPKFLNGMERR